jgi:hypothetical protein
MTLPDFIEWPSIQRLSSETITITEKIDGTCGVIYVSDEGEVIAGSRNGWLEDDKPDNFGFRAWVRANESELKHFGAGYHYGEWYGSGIQRRYGLNEKRFASFEWWNDDLPSCVKAVPILYQGPWSALLFDETVSSLAFCGSSAVPGFMDPEGIVIQFKSNCARSTKFKKFCKNDQTPKSKQKE